MRAALYTGFGEPVEVAEVSDPLPGDDDVIVRVMATGVCRSDWHGWQGHDPDIRTFPHVPGHEMAGVVETVGQNVVGWESGDRVTVPFVAGCGRCELCQKGEPQVCADQSQPGFTHWGSFAELVRVRHAQHNLVRIPDGFGFAEAAVLGCRFSTAYRAVIEQGAVQPGEWVAVYGCGGVGLSAVMIAAAAGASVIAIDTNPAALELARSLGGAHKVASSRKVSTQVLDISSGGVHVAIDAIGDAGVVASSIASLRPKGRHIQVGLLAGQEVPVRLDRLIGQELELLGSHGIAAASFPAMFDLITSQSIDVRSLVGQQITLEEGARLLETLDDRTEPGMAVITGFQASGN
ncbi:MAG: alcohol dehydrogenase catalytic domain-containing protein [Acidimicrobiia bacterium]